MGLFDRLKGSNQTEKLQERLEKQGKGGYQKDSRFWKWSWNKKGVSENVIRLLPTPYVDMQAVEQGNIDESMLTPMACIVRHQFRGPGGFYSENSPSTFGEDCPVRDHDRPLWDLQKKTEDKELKEKLKERIGKDRFICNILVINDANAPENNGKVFLFEVPYTLKKFIDTATSPKFSSDVAFDPFDLWEGANILLNLVGEERSFNGWTGLVPKFEGVKWDKNAPLGDDAYMEEIWQQEHSIADFYARKHFQSYEELEKILRKVLAIPDGVPLVENGVGSVAHAPLTQKPNEEMKKADATKVHHEAVKTTDSGVQAEVKATQQPAATGSETASVEDFDNWLKESQD